MVDGQSLRWLVIQNVFRIIKIIGQNTSSKYLEDIEYKELEYSNKFPLFRFRREN